MGPVFDRTVVAALEGAPDCRAILELAPSLVKRAGVCGYKPLAMLLGSLPGASSHVFSYEGPLGVGYACAGLQPDPALEPALLGLAREAVEAHVEGRPAPVWPRPLPPALARRAGVFVTLRRAGQLRGCIGTLQPVRSFLAEEVSAAAVGACSRDPRFTPVTRFELSELSYSVCVLGPLEPIKSELELDPRRYGVVVRNGHRSGCLLPGIESITSPGRQVELARRKGEIGPREAVTLLRFEVERYEAEL
jgi:AmmeMemoRadiSam system protein A